MNLSKLFEMQRKLDERIIEEKGLHGQDLLDKKILALQVELGELAQNWRGFKFWSNDQEPRIVEYRDCPYCGGHGVIDCFPFGAPDETHAYEEQCPECVGGQVEYNPLLEEYVDCLHFILSIGLEKGYDKYPLNSVFENHIRQENITQQFIGLIASSPSVTSYAGYLLTLQLFIGLGEMLGFTWEEVEQAYLQKNAENHRRQKVGY